jgi:DNA-directed RNA polymerase sigma subunit (sigma70/sigma32)
VEQQESSQVTTPDPAPDPVATSLDDLVRSIERIDALARTAAERAERRRAQREEGRTYRDILADEERPLFVELVSEMTEALIDAGGRFRRAQARALYDEGATMDQIAELFGVSRQRVSTLLASTRRADEGD